MATAIWVCEDFHAEIAGVTGLPERANSSKAEHISERLAADDGAVALDLSAHPPPLIKSYVQAKLCCG